MPLYGMSSENQYLLMNSRDHQTTRHSSRTDDQFCHRCRIFQPATWKDGELFRLHETFEELEVAAAQGCSFCRLIRQAIFFAAPNIVSRIQNGDNDLDRKPVAIEAPVCLEPNKSSDGNTSAGQEASTLWEVFRIVIPEQRLADARLYRRAVIALLWCSRTDLGINSHEQTIYRHMSHYVQPPPTPSDSLSKIKQWLHDCSSLHSDRCLTSAKMRRENPTRLLDIGAAPTDDLRIVSLAGSYWRKYCALSYCWGNSSTRYLTTEKLLAQNMQSIPANRLPRVFQDAIFVTRALGVRYLWIDALCIIQDSQQDWETEMTRMAAVYHNAYCTIAATVTYSADQSFLGPRDAFLYPARECEFSGYTFHPPIIQMSEAVDEAPMNRRAWCFQERVLSRRTVHFSHQGVFWECLETFGAECLPTESLDSSTAMQLLPGKLLESSQYKIALVLNFVSQEDVRQRPDLRSTLQAMWLDLIEQFSRCGLTKENDRLPALSGVAQLMAEITNDEYIAGMWKSSLSTELQWCARRSKETKRTEIYVGPSWSWVSIKGGVMRADKEWEHDVSNNDEDSDEESDWILKWAIINVACVPDSPSPFGMIRSAEIRIRSITETRRAICTISILGPILLTEYPNRIINLEGHGSFGIFSAFDTSSWPNFLGFLPTDLKSSNKTYMQYLVISEPEDVGPLYSISTKSIIIPVVLEKEPFDPITDCTFLEIKRRSSARHPGTWDVHALILETVDPAAGIYRRVGYAKLQSSAAIPGWNFDGDSSRRQPFFSDHRPVEVVII